MIACDHESALDLEYQTIAVAPPMHPAHVHDYSVYLKACLKVGKNSPLVYRVPQMERRFLLPVSVLFLVLTQTTSTAVTAAGSRNGGCPHRDPEEETLRPETECRIPPYSNPARIVHGPPNFVEDESNLIESRCYLACVNEVRLYGLNNPDKTE